MGERPSISASSSSSTLSSKSVANALGRMVPSFGRASPSTTAPPSSHPSLPTPPSFSHLSLPIHRSFSNPSLPTPLSFKHPSLRTPPSFGHPSIPPIALSVSQSLLPPSIPPTLTLTSTTSTVMNELMNETVSSNDHEITSILSHVSSQSEKIIPPLLSRPDVQSEWVADNMASFVDYSGNVTSEFEEEMRSRGFNAETITSTNQEFEKTRAERKSALPAMFTSFEAAATREEGDFLLLERSNSADICELMMRETKNDSPIREFEDQERESVQALVKRMIKEGAGPIKISEWAEEAGFDDYYLKQYAEELLPKRIMKTKDDNFVMGDTFAEYLHLFKIIYTQEIMVMLNRGDTISEETISEDLGVDSLLDSLAMEWSSTAFNVEKKNGATKVTKRV
ncbi:hypothetical protein PRIPAC_82775 [Pristionchus pacificus]|nr:hypothetical protein PRIPAC_82775 [Pristionchus pacificus]